MSQPFYTDGQCDVKHLVEVDASWTRIYDGKIYVENMKLGSHPWGIVLGATYEDFGYGVQYFVITSRGKFYTGGGSQANSTFVSASIGITNIVRLDGQVGNCGNAPTEPNGNPANPQPQACTARMPLSK